MTEYKVRYDRVQALKIDDNPNQIWDFIDEYNKKYDGAIDCMISINDHGGERSISSVSIVDRADSSMKLEGKNGWYLMYGYGKRKSDGVVVITLIPDIKFEMMYEEV